MKSILFIMMFLLGCSSYAQNVENLLDFVSTKKQDQINTIDQAALAYKHGNFKYGIKLLKKKIKKSGVFYDAYLFIGYGERSMKNSNKALEYYNKSIIIGPKFPIGYFLRGNVFLEMEKYRLALKDYKRCIKLDSLFYPAYNNLALTKVFNQGESDIHQRDFKMAKNELELLLNCNEDMEGIESIYFNLGLIHLQLNQYYDAMCFFNKAESSEKLTNKANYYKAVTKFNIKLYSSAASDFKKSLSNNYRSEECEKYLSLIRLITQRNK